MTQQIPQLASISAQAAAKARNHGASTAQLPAHAGFGQHTLAAMLPPGMLLPFSHQQFPWMGDKSFGQRAMQQPGSAPSHHLPLRELSPDAILSLQREMSGQPAFCDDRCSSDAHVVPASPSPAASELQWPASSEAEAGITSPPAQPPRTPELPLKRKREDDYQQSAIVPSPRTHSRKNRFPHRAAEAVAEDPVELRFSPVRASSPYLSRKPGRHYTPERIHLHKKAAAKAASSGGAPSLQSPNVHKECADCHTLKTPMWRRVDGVVYCNACGLRRTRALVGR